MTTITVVDNNGDTRQQFNAADRQLQSEAGFKELTGAGFATAQNPVGETELTRIFATADQILVCPRLVGPMTSMF